MHDPLNVTKTERERERDLSLHRNVRTGSGALPAFCQCIPEDFFPWSEVARAVDMNTFLYLVARVRMSGAIPQLPYMSS